MRIEGDSVILSSGKKLYANRGIIGLTTDLNITTGYDGGLVEDRGDLTPEDYIEISDYMVSRWLEVGLEAEEEMRQDDSKERESEAENFFNGC